MNLTAGPFKRKMVFQDPAVRFMLIGGRVPENWIGSAGKPGASSLAQALAAEFFFTFNLSFVVLAVAVSALTKAGGGLSAWERVPGLIPAKARAPMMVPKVCRGKGSCLETMVQGMSCSTMCSLEGS